MIDEKLFANKGVHFLNDTTKKDGKFYGFIVNETAVIAALNPIVSNNVTGDITGTSFPAGFTLFIAGGFDSITLASGKVTLLKG